jgi:predicted O-methyltransferase YrrM
MPTKKQYDEVFELERLNVYPAMDDYEKRAGFSIGRAWLENAARVLACPVKVNPPNWQHGRLIYAALRKRVEGMVGRVVCLDIGTAKGFSALVMCHALHHAPSIGVVVSVDVVDPEARLMRNTVAEIDGPKTVAETLDAVAMMRGEIRLIKSSGVDYLLLDYLRATDERIHFAFVDGKHSYESVSQEWRLLQTRQHIGDVAVFDDIQIEGVGRAVSEIAGYQIEQVLLKPGRAYAVATRV